MDDAPFVLRYEQETIQLNTIKRTAVSITEIAVFFVPKFKMKGEKENELKIVIQPNQRAASSYIRNFSKRVRKKESAVVLASQNLEDCAKRCV